MVIYLAADHAGFALKEAVKKVLIEKCYDVKDAGAYELDPKDDYPDFIKKAAEALSKNPDSRAILFGGSGEGEAMVANRFPGVRAVVFYGPEVAKGAVDATGKKSADPFEIIKLSRQHNDSNALSLGARFVSEQDALTAIKLWLETPFSGDPRHERRIKEF